MLPQGIEKKEIIKVLDNLDKFTLKEKEKKGIYTAPLKNRTRKKEEIE